MPVRSLAEPVVQIIADALLLARGWKISMISRSSRFALGYTSFNNREPAFGSTDCATE